MSLFLIQQHSNLPFEIETVLMKTKYSTRHPMYGDSVDIRHLRSSRLSQ